MSRIYALPERRADVRPDRHMPTDYMTALEAIADALLATWDPAQCASIMRLADYRGPEPADVAARTVQIMADAERILARAFPGGAA